MEGQEIQITMKLTADTADLLFRALFCVIFVGLGAEHLFSDDLIQRLMPDWVPFERAVSIGCGLWLMGWGSLILLGLKVRWAAIALGVFLVIVTAAVHLPGVFSTPGDIDPRNAWMWDILQRSNLAKNMCLLGVCFHLLHHRVGKYSLEQYAGVKFRKGEQDCPRVQFLDTE
jgi:uncharacterized membrane protein YphA (DoxX/SURF4 family)